MGIIVQMPNGKYLRRIRATDAQCRGAWEQVKTKQKATVFSSKKAAEEKLLDKRFTKEMLGKCSFLDI